MVVFGVKFDLNALEKEFTASYDGCLRDKCAARAYTTQLHTTYIRSMSASLGLKNSLFAFIGIDEGRDEFPHTATLLSEWTTLSLVGDPKYMNASHSYAVEVSPHLPASDRCPPNERAMPKRFFEPYDMQLPIPSPLSAPLPDTSYFYPLSLVWDVARTAAGYPDTLKHQINLVGGGRGATKAAEIGIQMLQHDVNILTRPRSLLLFSAASNVSCARVHVSELHGCQLLENNTRLHCPKSDIAVFNGLLPPSVDYGELLLSSRYCLNLAGSWVTATVRLYDIIQSGCIPVIVTDDFVPPFADFLDWRKFAIFLRTVHVPHIESILRSIPPEIELQMRTRLVQVRPAFSWQALPFWQVFWNTLRIAFKRRTQVLSERVQMSFGDRQRS
eukprot:GDKI01046059.1.p1 GENE.GDKI01046059.1~~GDKI01046059.1.p1  ORF type:complete len:387 (+),score=88.77 GDKI01046059.1:266-1426(+)